MRYLVLALISFVVLAVSCGPSSREGAAPVFGKYIPQGPAPRLDRWRILGMGGGGTTRMVRISPHDPDLILAQSDMTDAFITADGGRSWRMFNLLDGVNAFGFDPGQADTLYAGNQALWRSRDRGRSWHMLFPDPATIATLYWVTDDAECHIKTSDPLYPGSWQRIQAIAVNPADPDYIVIAFSGDPGLLLVSPDGGLSWETQTELDGGAVKAMKVFPTGSPYGPFILIIQENRIVMGGQGVWLKHPTPDGRPVVSASVGDSEDGRERILYAATNMAWEEGVLKGGLYATRNMGKTWEALHGGMAGNGNAFQEEEHWRYTPRFRAVACVPDRAETCYAGFRGLRGRLGEPLSGIARTEDAGRTWVIVNIESSVPNPAMGCSYIENRAPDSYPNVWFDDPYGLDAAAGNPDTCIASDLFRIYRTDSGGKTWQQVNTVPRGKDLWQTNGIDVTNCYGVHWDPFDPRHMYISYTDMGLHQSWDGGRSWQGATAGMPDTWRNTTYWIELDPEKQGLMWAACSAAHDLPRPRMFRKRDTDTFEGGVCTSADGGKSWTVTSEGLPAMAVTHILLDPQSPVGRRTLYATGFGRGVYKSVDNGQTWARKNKGLIDDKPLCWRLTRDAEGVLYLVVSRRSEKGEIGDAGDGALYRSRDGAETWEALPLPTGTNGPTELTVDPSDNRRLYLAMWGRFRSDGDIGGGLFMSPDAGRTWEQLFNGDQHLYSVTVDRRNSEILYTAGFESSVYRSSDRGRNWQRLKGFNFKAAHRVFPDPADPDSIYITTFGGSLWHGPAAGDPDAPGDVATPLPGKQGAWE